MPRTLVLTSVGVALSLALGPAPASGYEFEVIARTIGQGQALRSFRFTRPDAILIRRRITQTLSLDIWDIGSGIRDRRAYDRLRHRGPRIYIESYLRIDHDFGDFTTGSLVLGNTVYDAVDLIPELDNHLVALDLLYGYLAIDDLFDGLLDVRVGRQLDVGAMDWWSMDGVTARITPRAPFAVQAHVGLRVRDASPLGSDTHEPDGTGSAECAEYVEGQVPGSGSWRPIDRDVIVENDPFASDYELCPQRRQLMPTFGGAVELAHIKNIWASVSYRRSVSRTPGLIGDVDRFAYPDTGLYPDENGQAPDWGVNEDKLTASVRANRYFARGRGQVTPYAGLRYNALVGAVDEHHTGVRLRYGMHTLEPEYFYSLPTFDGDSIFNVFSAQAYHDLRMTYGLRPERSPFSGYARAWVRRFHTEDEPDTAGDEPSGDWAGGVQLGLRYTAPRRISLRVDLFQDTGYGGSRAGGYTSVAWHFTDNTGLSARLSLLHFDEDLRDSLSGVSVGLQTGASYRFNDGVYGHLTAEQTSNRVHPSQFRLMGVIEFALVPQT